ncbi:acyltransferase family protein [Piscinibacter sakaiensis]|uniref:acyltransferase family protein n=1 Tax=Piscinibacter sakaiensis TaxID=1547922 RepID=UPI003AAC6FC9
MSSTTAEFESIRALRGVAALLVAVSHLAPFLPSAGHGWAAFPFALGKVGVDIFFVISGFVMALATASLPAGRSGALGFLWRRIARIVPLYWIVTLALVAAIALDMNLGAQRSVDIERLLRSLLFFPVHTEEGGIRPIIAVGWSLDYEMYFYLCMTAVLCLTHRHRLLGTAALIAIIYLLARPALDPGVDWVVNSGLVAEFLFGYLAAVCYRNRRATGLLLAAAVAACLYSWSLILQLHPYGAGFDRSFSWGAVALIVVAGLAALEHRVPIGRIPLLAGIGDASYALYLIHVPVFAIVHRLIAGLALQMPPVVLFATMLLAATLASVAMHRLIERPLTVGLQRRSPFAAGRAAPPRPAGHSL